MARLILYPMDISSSLMGVGKSFVFFVGFEQEANLVLRRIIKRITMNDITTQL